MLNLKGDVAHPFDSTPLYSPLCLRQNDVPCAKESQQRPSKSHHKGRVSIRVMYLLSTHTGLH